MFPVPKNIVHKNNIINKPKKGEKKKKKKLTASKRNSILLNSLIASAKGWKSPEYPTLLGPIR